MNRVGGRVIRLCGHELCLALVCVDFGKVRLKGDPIAESGFMSFSLIGALFVEQHRIGDP